MQICFATRQMYDDDMYDRTLMELYKSWPSPIPPYPMLLELEEEDELIS